MSTILIAHAAGLPRTLARLGNYARYVFPLGGPFEAFAHSLDDEAKRVRADGALTLRPVALPVLPASEVVVLTDSDGAETVLALRKARPRDGSTFDAYVTARRDGTGLAFGIPVRVIEVLAGMDTLTINAIHYGEPMRVTVDGGAGDMMRLSSGYMVRLGDL